MLMAFACVLAVVCTAAAQPRWEHFGQSDLAPNGSLFFRWDPDGPGPRPEALAMFGGDIFTHGLWTLDGDRWTRELSAPSSSVAGACVLNGKVIAASGQRGGASGLYDLLAWDGQRWIPFAPGFDRRVEAMVAYRGQVYVMRRHVTAWENSKDLVERWNGSAWETVLAANNPNIDFMTLLVFRDRLLLGRQDTFGQEAWAYDGQAWDRIGNRGALLFADGGDLYAAPYFGDAVSKYVADDEWTTIASSSRRIVRFGVTQGAVMAYVFPPTTAPPPRFSYLATFVGGVWSAVPDSTQASIHNIVSHDGRLLLGGNGLDLPWSYLTAWSPAQGLTPTGVGFNRDPSSAIEHDGCLVVAGRFSMAPGLSRALHVASFDGSTWSQMGAGLPISGIDSLWTGPECLLEFRSQLIAIGVFRAGGPTTIGHRVAAWDGAAWAPLGGGLERTGLHVHDATVYQDRLYVLGYIQTEDVQSFPTVRYYEQSLLRWDGTAWEDLSELIQPGPPTTSLDLASRMRVCGDYLYIGGSLRASGQTSFNGLCRFDGATISPVPGWDPMYAATRNVLWLGEMRGELLVGSEEPWPPGGFRADRFDGKVWRPDARLSSFSRDFRGSFRSGPHTLVAVQPWASDTPADPSDLKAIWRWNGSEWHPFVAQPPIRDYALSGWKDALLTYQGDLLALLTTPGQSPSQTFHLARLRGLCHADLTGSALAMHPAYGRPDGRLTNDDLFCFIVEFLRGNMTICDLTGPATPGKPDGTIGNEDFLFYLELFAVGCP